MFSSDVLPPRRPDTPLAELDDIQGLLRHGYPFFDGAAYCLFRIDDPASARRPWLQTLLHPDLAERWIDDALRPSTRLRDEDSGVAIAFTPSGLSKLGLSADALATFIPEFREGMAVEHRARQLGDIGPSRPSEWAWGRDAGIDGVLIVYAPPDNLRDRVQAISRIPGCPVFARVILTRLYLQQGIGVPVEPFGFADGISQPYIEGVTLKAPPEGVRIIRTGEFVLGYPNEIDRLPASPSIAVAEDPNRVLPRLPHVPRADFGRNGTFLVMRQLEQNVAAFNQFVNGDPDPSLQGENLAARMVGRWPNGEPLARTRQPRPPGEVTKTALEDGNNFGYDREDRHGFECPVGAHIRRANPRDALAQGQRISPAEAQRLVDQHRILRRGRTYRDEDTGAEGLIFVCLNANIERQFEFVQSSWLMHPEFAGLSNEPDPLIGNAPRRFTLQHPLLGQCRADLPQFVTVRGGGYFFLPGLRSLRYLSQL
ncbi:MAG TPA: hypothetical protein VEU32_21805 [Burkholderiales bacterium]|nr:hypothetical protein [Burkholderiales bacterium]